MDTIRNDSQARMNVDNLRLLERIVKLANAKTLPFETTSLCVYEYMSSLEA